LARAGTHRRSILFPRWMALFPCHSGLAFSPELCPHFLPSIKRRPNGAKINLRLKLGTTFRLDPIRGALQDRSMKRLLFLIAFSLGLKASAAEPEIFTNVYVVPPTFLKLQEEQRPTAREVLVNAGIDF